MQTAETVVGLYLERGRRLDRPGQGEKPLWVKRMASRRRKTLVVCQRCHEDIHRKRPQRRKKRVEVTGEPW